jgi:hypothetical protein
MQLRGESRLPGPCRVNRLEPKKFSEGRLLGGERRRLKLSRTGEALQGPESNLSLYSTI